MQVLIVDDDESVARFLGRAIKQAGHVTQVVHDGFEAIHLARSGHFDLILLDVVMPRIDGFEVCRRIRMEDVSTPIMLVTAQSAIAHRVEGLDAGADDYLVKPFDVSELLARARALMRRSSNASAPVLRVGDLELDPAARAVRRESQSLRLSNTEFSLLEYLMRNARQVLPRAVILSHVWAFDFDGNDNVLDVYISYLRAKIDRGYPRPYIHTVRGVGYCLAEHSPA